MNRDAQEKTVLLNTVMKTRKDEGRQLGPQLIRPEQSMVGSTGAKTGHEWAGAGCVRLVVLCSAGRAGTLCRSCGQRGVADVSYDDPLTTQPDLQPRG
jgi:hypothetical protein